MQRIQLQDRSAKLGPAQVLCALDEALTAQGWVREGLDPHTLRSPVSASPTDDLLLDAEGAGAVALFRLDEPAGSAQVTDSVSRLKGTVLGTASLTPVPNLAQLSGSLRVGEGNSPGYVQVPSPTLGSQRGIFVEARLSPTDPWLPVTNGGPLPGVSPGDNLSGRTLYLRQRLEFYPNAEAPTLDLFELTINRNRTAQDGHVHVLEEAQADFQTGTLTGVTATEQGLTISGRPPLQYAWQNTYYKYYYQYGRHPASEAEMDDWFNNEGPYMRNYTGEGVRSGTWPSAYSLHWGDTQQAGTAPKPTDIVTRADFYSFMYFGSIYIPVTGQYSFAIDADDCCDLHIDGVRVCSSYVSSGRGMTGTWDVQGTVQLTQGWHTFRARFEEVGGGDGIRMGWKKPGDPDFSLIPLSAFNGEAATGTGRVRELPPIDLSRVTRVEDTLVRWLPKEADGSGVTLEVWYTPEHPDLPGDWMYLAGKGAESETSGYCLLLHGNAIHSAAGLLRFYMPYNGYLEATVRFLPGQTYHIVGTVDGTRSALYVNGLELVSGNGKATMTPFSASPFRIGLSPAGNYRARGRVSAVGVYGRGLSRQTVLGRTLAGLPNLPRTFGVSTVDEPVLADFTPAFSRGPFAYRHASGEVLWFRAGLEWYRAGERAESTLHLLFGLQAQYSPSAPSWRYHASVGNVWGNYQGQTAQWRVGADADGLYVLSVTGDEQSGVLFERQPDGLWLAAQVGYSSASVDLTGFPNTYRIGPNGWGGGYNPTYGLDWLAFRMNPDTREAQNLGNANLYLLTSYENRWNEAQEERHVQGPYLKFRALERLALPRLVRRTSQPESVRPDALTLDDQPYERLFRQHGGELGAYLWAQ